MKICPETNSPVLYLDCLECEEKSCRKPHQTAKGEPEDRKQDKDTDRKHT